MIAKKQKEIAYLNQNGKYLIFTIEGKSFILESKDQFDKYIKENNCKINKH